MNGMIAPKVLNGLDRILDANRMWTLNILIPGRIWAPQYQPRGRPP